VLLTQYLSELEDEVLQLFDEPTDWDGGAGNISACTSYQGYWRSLHVLGSPEILLYHAHCSHVMDHSHAVNHSQL